MVVGTRRDVRPDHRGARLHAQLSLRETDIARVRRWGQQAARLSDRAKEARVEMDDGSRAIASWNTVHRRTGE